MKKIFVFLAAFGLHSGSATITVETTALGITALPVCSIKSVWLREQPPEKDPPSKSGG